MHQKWETSDMEKKRKKEEADKSAREKKKSREKRLELKRKLEEKWSMMRWLVNYIEDNKEQWRVDKAIRQNENKGEIMLSKDVLNENENEEKIEPLSKDEKWDEWRERAKMNMKNRKKSTRVAKLSQVGPVDKKEAEINQEEQGELGERSENEILSGGCKNENENVPDMDVDEIKKFRHEIENNTKVAQIAPSGSVVRMMNRFYRKLEESVWRMSALGCIGEEDENTELVDEMVRLGPRG